MTGRPRTLLLRRSPRFRQLSDAAVSGVLELLVVDGSFHPGVAERHSRSTELRAPGFVSERAQGPFPPLWPTRRRLCGFPAPRSRRAISPCASRGPYALARRARCAPRPSSTSAGVHRKRTASADPERGSQQSLETPAAGERQQLSALGVPSHECEVYEIAGASHRSMCPGVHSHDQRVVHGRERLQALDA